MKHNWKITAILIGMFLVTQIIGLIVINAYTPRTETIIINGIEQNVSISPQLPYGMQPPEEIKPICPPINSLLNFLICIKNIIPFIIAFTIAIFVIFLLSKFKAKWFLRAWFFVVVILALGITLYALLFYLKIPYGALIALLIALPLAIYKIFKQHILIHNLTELMIYPGIAAVFVPILNIWTVIVLLIAISAYDIWAVWHAGFMQKMAKFQIQQLKLFAGFFVPYAGKKQRQEIKAIKQKYKNQKIPNAVFKKKKIKISLAILGGGDVIFPLIAAGIFLRTFGLFEASIVTLFATLALAFLFIAARKGKFYPAMPYLTSGVLIGMLIATLI